MKERPILFSGEMVRAILDGKKTQTRRVVKPQPDHRHCKIDFENGELKESSQINGCWHVGNKIKCPYGQPGDRLWVRETWAEFKGIEPKIQIVYKADKTFDTPAKEHLCDGKWKPSIHMRREYSRINLEITNIRIERLQDISEEDCISEGIEIIKGLSGTYYKDYSRKNATAFNSAKLSYRSLWELINGSGSWDKNPWVWVVEFRRVL